MRTSSRNKIFSLIILFLIVIALNFFQKELKSFFYYFSSPIQETFWGAGEKGSDFLEGLLSFSSLQNEIDSLKEEKQGLISEILKLKEREKENVSLRKALDLGLEKEYKLSLAQIISKDFSEDIVLINKGSSDGVKEEMIAITENKVLVGKVIEVFDKYSKVMLASHQDLSFDVKIEQEEKEISAIANGQGDSNISLSFIPQEENIFAGDIVSTSYLGGIFPECLLIGEIEDVKKSDVDPFQIAKIKNALNIKEIKNIFLIIND